MIAGQPRGFRVELDGETFHGYVVLDSVPCSPGMPYRATVEGATALGRTATEAARKAFELSRRAAHFAAAARVELVMAAPTYRWCKRCGARP